MHGARNGGGFLDVRSGCSFNGEETSHDGASYKKAFNLGMRGMTRRTGWLCPADTDSFLCIYIARGWDARIALCWTLRELLLVVAYGRCTFCRGECVDDDEGVPVHLYILS